MLGCGAGCGSVPLAWLSRLPDVCMLSSGEYMARKKSISPASPRAGDLTSEMLQQQIDDFIRDGGSIEYVQRGISGYGQADKGHSGWSRVKPQTQK